MPSLSASSFSSCSCGRTAYSDKPLGGKGDAAIDLFNPYVLGTLIQAFINVLLGLSIYITFSAGLLSVGNAGFMSIGAYTAALIAVHWQWPMVFGLAAAACMGALAGLLLGIPTLRLRGVYLAIATLGFGEVVRVTLHNLQFTGGALGVRNIPSFVRVFRQMLEQNAIYNVWGLTSTQWAQLITLFITIAVGAIIVFAILRQENSRIGRAIRALGADEVAADVAGISIVRYRMLVFVEGAAVAGLAGGFYAYFNNVVHPEIFGYHRAVDILLYAVLGGSGIVWGPVVGALSLSLIPESLRFLQDYKLVIFGALVVIMMAVRPQGLIDKPLVNTLKATLHNLLRFKSGNPTMPGAGPR